MARKITFLDKTFWITESEDNPKHVACLQIIKKPANASASYVSDLYHEAKQHNEASEPFNCRVVSFLRFPLMLKTVDKVDMDYHIKMHHVDDVTDREALHEFIARLHEEILDRDKPLWQFHLISDDKSDTFAIYAKIHHIYGDGATLVRWFQAGYLTEPSDKLTPLWYSKRKRRERPKPNIFKQIVRGAWEFINVVKDLLIVLIRIFMKILRINRHYMPVPFTGTRTVLTGQVKKGRCVSTMDIDFNRVKALGRRARASANEILLTAFDIGVHRFLQDYGQTFEKALFTNMPINLRKPGDHTGGNKIAIVPVELAHDEHDPYLRMRQIIANHRIVKYAAMHARPGAFSYYTILIQSFALLFEVFRLSDWVKPIANILISNVPGPEETRYLKDAELLAVYPISTMTPGGGVNITLMSYDGTANVGIVCTNRKVESLEPLAEYFAEAFEMLERSIDDPTLNIDDIGEHNPEVPQSIITEEMTGDEHHDIARLSYANTD
ncbi:wax ester/triacylglycerol synthase domain-containing protein [Aestuariibacter salexigens]|uniref:wax ester/triacylglycerol synthase domain-containing protein n=1 Tax=Aestuariibacter salexigens TaxID=226010 RepID=UPI0003F6C87B|nr:wax ester/triacylglycerol synthase domain-containing protein [Aestuariibacter salexigens]